jgi:hypothetical protein
LFFLSFDGLGIGDLLQGRQVDAVKNLLYDLIV